MLTDVPELYVCVCVLERVVLLPSRQCFSIYSLDQV